MYWSKKKPTEKFEQMWSEHGSVDYVKEHKCIPGRRFRFDYAWPEFLQLVEIQGFGYGHQSVVALVKDCEKARLATLEGWTVMSFTTKCVSSRDRCLQAVEQVNDVLAQRIL